MQIRKSHRIIAALLALVMVVGMLPTTAFAKTAGKDGSAEMNEAYAAKETLMPVGPSFSTYTLLEWTPESDPDAMYSRASIKLADRVGGFVVNPLVNPEAKLMLCSLANSDHDNTSAQGTESFLSYAFNYWQYTNSFVYWSGSEEGLICCPTGEFIDAAHTNGVPVVATLGFPWGSGSGYVQEVKDFVQKAEDGSFPVADKLIEVMDYYGFDGYFFNQESYGCSAAEGQLIDEMMRYMHQKRPDMLISWYDSMLPSGGVSYQNAVTDANKQFMTDSEDGTRAIDEFMMNYNWYESQINTTISTMKSIGRSQFDAFAGIDVQQNCMDTPFRDYLLVDEDGMTRMSLALYCPNSTLGLSTSGENFHEVEQVFYTNAKGDPRDTSVSLNSSDWAGMSRFYADKTVILSAPFVTDFNSGHGKGYYVDGVLSRDAEWSYQSNQDVTPTWTWIIDSEGEKLSGGYDFTTAYNGGNSIKFSGNLTANKANQIMIFSTKVTVESGMKLDLTYKGDQGLAKLVAYYGDESTTSYDACEKVEYALTDSNGAWTTTTADISASAGKILYAIGLKVESSEDVSDYQINLGRLTITEKDRAALSGPASITLDEIMYSDAYTAEARIYWSSVTGASSYEIYKVHADGTKTLIMETPSTAFYIPTLSRDADETDVTLEIVAINRNGVRGTEGTKLVIDWAYTNDDSEKVEVVNFENVCLNAEVTGVSFENSGEPASKALDGTSANNSKWCATNNSYGWMSIDIGREVTVKRWRVEHAEYGGEANNMNTVDFSLKYKNADGEWVEIKRIQNNTLAVTDVLLDEPITAREWMLYVYDDGSSPWGGIRIYEWQMFETDQFPQTEPTAMHFASAVNGAGATDTFTLKNVPSGQTVKVYTKTADGYTLIGETTSTGTTVVLDNLDFGTADAGRVYYTTTALASEESAKLSTSFEAETVEKSAAATNVSFVKYSHAGSTSSSNGDGIYTTLTVSDLNPGDVVYVYENGSDAEYTKVSQPVAEGETSVSINRVYVIRAGGTLALQVKRTGKLISDIYTVDTPELPEPTATVRLYARNTAGESLTGARYGIYDTDGNEVAQISTTSDSGGVAAVELGTYTVKALEAPEGYGISKEILTIHVTTEGAAYEWTLSVPDYADPELYSVTLSPAEVTAIRGDVISFTAVVDGIGNYSEELSWTVSGAASSNTTITDDGVLTIGDDETAKYVTVKAVAEQDGTTCDYVDVIIVNAINVAKDSSVLGYNGSLSGTDNGPEKLVDGDATTKWEESLVSGDDFLLGAFYLGQEYEVVSVKLYHAGSAGEDTALNTDSFYIRSINENQDINTQFWLDYADNYNAGDVAYYLARNNTYYVTHETYSANTDNVTTLKLSEPAKIKTMIIHVTQANASTDDVVRLYEMEVLVADTSTVDATRLQILLDLIAQAEGLKKRNYTTDSWTVLTEQLTAAKEVAANTEATQEQITSAIDALRTALDALVEVEPEYENTSKDATIVAYNGAKLGDEAAGPEKLFDGKWANADTDKWCEDGNKWVAFDIGSDRQVTSLKLYHAGANNEWSPTPGAINTEAYEFYVLNTEKISVDELLAKSYEERCTLLDDASYWTLVASRTGNTDDITTDTLSNVTGRIFKINISDTDSTDWGQCVRLYELELYSLKSYFTITVSDEITHGTIVPSETDANVGETITLTVTPDEGYVLLDGSLKANGVVIEGLSFTMPDDDVVITAQFVTECEALKIAAEAAQKAAEEAKAAAEAAQKAAEEAAASAAADKEAAEAAKAKAEEAQKAAEAAQAAAEAAQKAAEENNAAAAEEAKKAAEEAAKAAEEAAKAAEAQKLAQEAQAAAEAAQKAAEEAAASSAENKEAAEAARKAAEEAQKAAEEAKKAANEAEYEAAASAREAAYSAAHAAEAQYAAQEAQEAAEEAAKVAEQAKADAEEAQKKAEEAAASAGADSETALEAAKEAKAAQEAAEAAQSAAEDAQSAAEAAKAAADESNKQAAESAAKAAQYAKEVVEAYAEIVKIKAELVDYMNEAQKAAEEAKKAALASSKYYALITLSEVSTDGLTEEQAAQVEAIVAEAVEAVNNAATASEVEEILAAALEAIEKASSSVCAADVFTDVNKDAWYHKSVDFMVNSGYMNGTGTDVFGTYDSLTRAQLVTILYRIAGSPSVEGQTHPFTDVPDGRYYTNAVIWAYNAGIVNGVSETAFDPAAKITRMQIATILYRYDGSNKVEEDHLADYADASNVPGYAVDGMNWAVANGIINGVISGEETILAPRDNATRAEIAAIIYRYLTK